LFEFSEEVVDLACPGIQACLFPGKADEHVHRVEIYATLATLHEGQLLIDNHFLVLTMPVIISPSCLGKGDHLRQLLRTDVNLKCGYFCHRALSLFHEQLDILRPLSGSWLLLPRHACTIGCQLFFCVLYCRAAEIFPFSIAFLADVRYIVRVETATRILAALMPSPFSETLPAGHRLHQRPTD